MVLMTRSLKIISLIAFTSVSVLVGLRDLPVKADVFLEPCYQWWLGNVKIPQRYTAEQIEKWGLAEWKIVSLDDSHNYIRISGTPIIQMRMQMQMHFHRDIGIPLETYAKNHLSAHKDWEEIVHDFGEYNAQLFGGCGKQTIIIGMENSKNQSNDLVDTIFSRLNSP